MDDIQIYKCSFPGYGIKKALLIAYDNSDCEYAPGYILHDIETGKFYGIDRNSVLYGWSRMLYFLEKGQAKLNEIKPEFY